MLLLAAMVAIIVVTHWPSARGPVDHDVPTPEQRVERMGPASAYTEARLAPGAVNPEITQANIEETICNPDWSTKLVRPPSSYTSKLKREQMRELGLGGQTRDFEEDHLISLELGGSPTDPRNLWPESYRPRPGAREKDVVENYLHEQVCAGRLTLVEAQSRIAGDWYRVYVEIRGVEQ